mmetsp:Transcript_8844/g.14715  ORF Transcript_8844/g.14715 Transcript_8844/m.14715 type:complete len:330 (+) Transcript_8844:96-1085(+)
MAARASDVFNRRFIEAGVFNNDTRCHDVGADFDSNDAVFKISFDSDSDCENLLTGFTSSRAANEDAIDVRINANAMTVAAAVNSGLYSADSLEQYEEDFSYTTLVEGTEYTCTVSPRYDTRYERSNVVYCFTPDDADQRSAMGTKCSVKQNNGIDVLPMLVPWSPDCLGCDDAAKVASCNRGQDSDDDDSNDDDGDDDDADGSISNPLMDLLLVMVYSHSGGLGTLIQLELNASKSENSPVHTMIHDFVRSTTLSNSIDGAAFHASFPDCTVMYVNTWDDSNIVTPYGYDLKNIHCQDTITLPAFKDLQEHPPFTLVEDFYECRDTLFQ